MTSNLRFVETLPVVNTNEQFIIINEAHTTLGEDWLAYAETLIDKAFDDKDTFKSIKDAIGKRGSLFSLSEKAKDFLGIGKKFSVIDISITGSKVNAKPILSYNDLVEMFFSTKNPKLYGLTQRTIIDRFFGFQWSRGKLLYPIMKMPPKYNRPQNWQELLTESKLSTMLGDWFLQKGSNSFPIIYRKQAINSILTSTKWYTPNDVIDSDLSTIQNIISEFTMNRKNSGIKERENHNKPNVRKILNFQILTMNELRYLLINEGREDIKKPRDIAKEKIKIKLDSDGVPIHRFDWIEINKYPNLIPIKEYAESYIVRLSREGLAIGTISASISKVNKLLRYFIEFYPFSKITIDTVDEMFEPKNKNSLINYLLNTSNSEEAAYNEISPHVKFLTHCELYSAKARKNMPIKKRKAKLQPYREAMPKEMVAHIVDIIKTRPPNSTTKWQKDRADISWWKFDVYPVYPMMMLFGYYVPLRGEQIRNLCRDNSFVFNSSGKIDKFVINTDKNVNRKYLQEIPCVWDDLQIFVQFLKWHKEYFKNLSKVRYKLDPNSPWEDIRPLMILPFVLKPMDGAPHFTYHKRLLCKYQLEKMEEAKQRGDDNYPIVAWSNNNKPFFKSIEELDNTPSSKMKYIDIAYDIHSLRVTGATRYLESGVGLSTVMELTGHMSAETLIRIYINLTREEKEVKLKSAIDKIYFGDKKNLVENSSDLIKGELTRAYQDGKENLETTLEDNALFSMTRKASYTDKTKRLEKGTEIATKRHPTSWMAMIHGICPGVKCPEGRENKCSLCPYLITGKLFMDGVVHQTNKKFAEFQRESLDLKEDEKRGYKSQSKMEGLETLLEEILGWKEILDKISTDIADEDVLQVSDNNEVIHTVAKDVFGNESIATELAYLKNEYAAQVMGVEHDRFGMKVLTIKAMQLAIKNNDKNQLDLISDDETKSIDMLMQYYTEKVEPNQNVNEFISSVKMISNK